MSHCCSKNGHQIPQVSEVLSIYFLGLTAEVVEVFFEIIYLEWKINTLNFIVLSSAELHATERGFTMGSERKLEY